VATLLFFGSLLLHELAHSLVARARGLRVESITLFVFGGVSNIAHEPTSAWEEFLVAVVGPVTSLVLAAVYWQIGQLVAPASTVAAMAEYLVYANLALGLFNLLPAYPLDGGRVFQSIVWALTGDETRATRIASFVGQAFAFGLVGWGVLRVIQGDISAGIWMVFVGWFLNVAAEGARRRTPARTSADVPDGRRLSA
jgi:Zn-dependent protease